MARSTSNTGYRKLVEKLKVPAKRPPSIEQELDVLLDQLEKGERSEKQDGAPEPDLVQDLREFLMNEMIPIFAELREKYAATGMALSMDAAAFLEGGREIGFEFELKGHRLQLLGTVTSDSIAFCETRYAPHLRGELVSGPMLRIRQLTPQSFRDFICEHLSVLVRSVARWP